MNKITLLILLITFSTYAQQGLKSRTKNIESHAKAKTTNDKDVQELGKAYASIKFEALDPVLKFEGEQKEKIEKLFIEQYQPLAEAGKTYWDNKTLQGKLDLIKLLISNEEAFRSLLTEEQKIYYLSYDPTKGFYDNFSFGWHFFTEKQLMEYKKELL